MSLIRVQVIDERMLFETLKKSDKEKLKDKDFSSEKQDDIINLITEASSLILSYKNIMKIENLIGFEKLTKLCLDNNSIETISNLTPLTNLKWLDLSFNKISKIERTISNLIIIIILFIK